MRGLAIVAFVLLVRPAFGLEVREAHYVMGTVLEIAVDAPEESVGRAWIRRAVAEARRLDAELTSFDPESPLMHLNAAAGQGFRRVPPDLFRILGEARGLTEATGGSFDVTVGPLVALWRDARARRSLPMPADLEAARARVGARWIALRAPDEVALGAPGVVLDLGGIGKGYAADHMAEALRAAGAKSALVSFGESSMVAIGAPRGREGWPIWVRRRAHLYGPLFLKDRALSTSGSRAQGTWVEKQFIGHIVDPRSGRALAVDAEATVLAPTATEAEAWSKALLVEPKGALRRLEAEQRLAALVFEGGSRRASGRFRDLTGRRLASAAR